MASAVMCDSCGSFARVTGGRVPDSFGRLALPEGWLEVSAVTGLSSGRSGEGDRSGGQFCRRECVSKFFAGPVGDVAS